MKLLSIAVPCYNCESTLAQTLDSFCIDELPLLDIIIVNDGSTDQSLPIAQSYADRHPDSFRVIDKPNGGHGSAVNAAIGQALGLYFKVVDGDDALEADGLRKLLVCIAQSDVDQQNSADLIAAHYKKVSAVEGSEVDMCFHGVKYGVTYSFSELPRNNGIYFGIHSITYKTALLQQNEIRLQEHTFYVDMEYGLLPIEYVNTIVFLDAFVYRYTVGSLTQSIDPANFVKRYDDHYRVVKRLVGFRKDIETDESHSRYIGGVLNKLCFTHYMLAAFYDDNSKRGRERAREFDLWLKNTDPELYKELGSSAYISFIRLTRFAILPKGKKLKSISRSAFGCIKRILPAKRKFTY